MRTKLNRKVLNYIYIYIYPILQNLYVLGFQLTGSLPKQHGTDGDGMENGREFATTTKFKFYQ